MVIFHGKLTINGDFPFKSDSKWWLSIVLLVHHSYVSDVKVSIRVSLLYKLHMLWRPPWGPGGDSLPIASDAGFGADLDGKTIEGVSNFEAWRRNELFFWLGLGIETMGFNGFFGDLFWIGDFLYTCFFLGFNELSGCWVSFWTFNGLRGFGLLGIGLDLVEFYHFPPSHIQGPGDLRYHETIPDIIIYKSLGFRSCPNGSLALVLPHDTAFFASFAARVLFIRIPMIQLKWYNLIALQ